MTTTATTMMMRIAQAIRLANYTLANPHKHTHIQTTIKSPHSIHIIIYL